MKKIFLTITTVALFLGTAMRLQAQEDFYDIHHVAEIRIYFSVSNWDHVLDSLIQAGEGDGRLLADISVDGHYISGVGVRYKGFSSWDEDQKKSPFNINLDYTINNQNHQGYKHIKLSNVIHDPSFVREAISYEVAGKYMPASRANFANVYVNDTLLGLYTNVESVDELFVKKYFGSKNNAFFKGSPANLQYPFGQNANLAYTHGTDTAGYMPFYKLESDHGWSELLNLIYILNNDTAHLPEVLNIDRTLWMHAFNYALVNLDSYIGYSQNYYLYKDENGRFNPILWDLNMSFGSFRHSDGSALNLTIAKAAQQNPLQHLYSTTFSPRPLTKNLFSNTRYRKMYLAHIRTIINENFRNGDYYTKALEAQNVIDNYVLNDTNKFYSYADFITNLDDDTGPISDQYPGIRSLMEARIAYLDTFPGIQGAPQISSVNNEPLRPQQGENTVIRASIRNASCAFLFYRSSSNSIFISTPMLDDGLHNDSLAGDSIYGASVAVNGKTLQYYIWAENDSAGIFSPERAEYEFYTIHPALNAGDIVINELTNNWVEIYNNTQEEQPLSGMYLGNLSGGPLKWAFPDTAISAGGYIMVKTAGSRETGAILSDIEIPAHSGQLTLGYEAGINIDTVMFDDAVNGKSIGRWPNGYGDFVFMTPTFAKHNLYGTTENTQLLVYPNPAVDKINVECEIESATLTIKVFTADGQVASDVQYSHSAGMIRAVSKEVDLSGMQSGVYAVQVICDDKILTRTFVIL
ncbi:MAG: CotH kinase family protein [Bacteroidota bacterium]